MCVFSPHVVLFFASSAVSKASVCVSGRLVCVFMVVARKPLSNSTPVLFYYFISGSCSGNAAAVSVDDGFGRRAIGVVSSESSRLLSLDVL